MPNLNLGLFSALLCIGVSAIISTNVNAAVPNYDSLKSELKAETRQFNRDMNASQKAFNAEMRAQAANDIYEYDMQELGNTLDARVAADMEADLLKDISKTNKEADKSLNKTIRASKSEQRQFNKDMKQDIKSSNAEMRAQAANDIYEYDMQKLGNTLDARKSGRTWATVGGAVGGAGLGVGIMELFGNRLIGGKVMGQKSLDEVELLYSQMTTTERAQYEEAITELGRACDELHALGGVHSACGD